MSGNLRRLPQGDTSRSLLPVLMLLVALAIVAVLLWLSSGAAVVLPSTDRAPTGDAGSTNAAGASRAHEPSQPETSRELIDEMIEGTWQLQVQVVDATGDPVANAAIEVQETRQAAAHVAGKTGGDGLCTLEAVRDRFLVRAHHAGTGRSLLVAANCELHAETPLRLLLWRPVQMVGLVLGADSQPWPGAHVSLEALELLYGSNSPHVSPSEVIADRMGRFSFEAAAAVPGSARLAMPGVSGVQVEWLASEGEEVVLAVPGALCIEGVVLDEQGNPTLAQVEVFTGPTPWSSRQRPESVVNFSLSPQSLGEHTVRAVTSDGRSASTTVTLSATQPRAYVELHLQRGEQVAPKEDATDAGTAESAGSIAMAVFTSDGRPAKGVRVAAARPLGQGFGELLASADRHEVVIDGRHLAKRAMRLLIVDQESDEFGVFEVAAGALQDRVTMTLGMRGSVAIEALHQGRAVRGVTLQLWTHHEPFFSGVGKHQLLAENVPPGPALVEVKRGFEVIARKEILVRPGVLTSESVEVEMR